MNKSVIHSYVFEEGDPVREKCSFSRAGISRANLTLSCYLRYRHVVNDLLELAGLRLAQRQLAR